MLLAKKAKKLCNMLLTIYFVFLMSLKGSDCGANVHKVEYAQNVQWIKKKACENNALRNSHFFGKSTFWEESGFKPRARSISIVWCSGVMLSKVSQEKETDLGQDQRWSGRFYPSSLQKEQFWLSLTPAFVSKSFVAIHLCRNLYWIQEFSYF